VCRSSWSTYPPMNGIKKWRRWWDNNNNNNNKQYYPHLRRQPPGVPYGVSGVPQQPGFRIWETTVVQYNNTRTMMMMIMMMILIMMVRRSEKEDSHFQSTVHSSIFTSAPSKTGIVRDRLISWLILWKGIYAFRDWSEISELPKYKNYFPARADFWLMRESCHFLENNNNKQRLLSFAFGITWRSLQLQTSTTGAGILADDEAHVRERKKERENAANKWSVIKKK